LRYTDNKLAFGFLNMKIAGIYQPNQRFAARTNFGCVYFSTSI